jgi:heme a synthase
MDVMLDPIWQFSLQTIHALAWGGSLALALYLFARYLPLRPLVVLTTIVTLTLVALGAYVRLTDAGLGCPDWPGCYGKLSPMHAEDAIRDAERVAPAGPVSVGKAWREMLHRYLASVVGVMILAISFRVWLNRRRRRGLSEGPEVQLGLPLLLVGAVILQGLFGKWTVTLLLKPAIVTLHLLGGMFILALLTWLTARHLQLPGARRPAEARAVRPWAALGLVVLTVQIALGGWVSTNYAALACVDFPTCHGTFMPDMDFEHGFHVLRELGMTAAGEPLSNDALNAIHWAHRVGALVTFTLLALLGYWANRVAGLRAYGTALLVALVVQMGLGITNVLAMLPLGVAVAHNAVAGLLLATLVMLNFALYSEPSR